MNSHGPYIREKGWRVVMLAKPIIFGLALLHVLAPKARAEIHDYMILRLLYLGTSCGVQHLERLQAPSEDQRRFKAICRDVNAYPHGIFVTCTDIADDRSCIIETAPKSFDSLELLQPHGSKCPSPARRIFPTVASGEIRDQAISANLEGALPMRKTPKA
jgi:hypothetical protein